AEIDVEQRGHGGRRGEGSFLAQPAPVRSARGGTGALRSRSRPALGSRPMLDTASPEARPASPSREAATRGLERLATPGLYLFAATAPISIALMQIGLWSSALAVVGLVALGVRPRLRSPLDLPVLALCGAAVLSQVLAFSWAGGLVNVILWRSFLTPLIVLA